MPSARASPFAWVCLLLSSWRAIALWACPDKDPHLGPLSIGHLLALGQVCYVGKPPCSGTGGLLPSVVWMV